LAAAQHRLVETPGATIQANHVILLFGKSKESFAHMKYDNRITIAAGKRGGKPCIRNMRISVYDVLGWLAAGMTEAQILSDYPELELQDIRACLAYAADREHQLVTSVAA
jgi:uncharacterized protein (DUF433 family)